MSDLTPERLDQIEKAAREASSVYGRGWHSEISLERDTHGRIPARHRDAKYIANMDPTTTLKLIAEVKRLRETLAGEATRHRQSSTVCGACRDSGRCHECYQVYPCAVVRETGRSEK